MNEYVGMWITQDTLTHTDSSPVRLAQPSIIQRKMKLRISFHKEYSCNIFLQFAPQIDPFQWNKGIDFAVIWVVYSWPTSDIPADDGIILQI